MRTEGSLSGRRVPEVPSVTNMATASLPLLAFNLPDLKPSRMRFHPDRTLMVDTRKWLMAKLAPKKYGDKIANEIGGPVEVNAITDMDRAKALAAMMARTLAQAPSAPAK